MRSTRARRGGAKPPHRLPSARELHVFYTPQPGEVASARGVAGSGEHLLALLVLAKCFGRLGYFPALADVRLPAPKEEPSLKRFLTGPRMKVSGGESGMIVTAIEKGSPKCCLARSDGSAFAWSVFGPVCLCRQPAAGRRLSQR